MLSRRQPLRSFAVAVALLGVFVGFYAGYWQPRHDRLETERKERAWLIEAESHLQVWADSFDPAKVAKPTWDPAPLGPITTRDEALAAFRKIKPRTMGTVLVAERTGRWFLYDPLPTYIPNVIVLGGDTHIVLAAADGRILYEVSTK